MMLVFYFKVLEQE